MAEANIVLELVIGVPRAPQDPYTNEPELDVINLLNVKGFAVKPDGWVPQLPSMKGGGLWADSALSAGRQLIAGEMGNVVETMTLTATGASMVTHLFLKSRLLQFAQRAKAFHTDWNEMQPVYLKWQAPGSEIAQYAIIYSIDVAVEDDAFEGDNIDSVVITLEREPAWRMGVPPGGNPIEWTYYSRDIQRGKGYQYDDMSLDSSASLVSATIQNRHEWAYNAGNPVTTPTSKNYIDITAAQVPGDAPALVSLVVSASVSTSIVMRRLLVWLSSRDMSMVDQDTGLPMASGYIMNAADMGAVGGTLVAGSVAQAVFNTAAVPARQFLRVGTAGAVIDARSDTGINNFWRRQFLRGRMAVYVRARSFTAAGTVSAIFSERGSFASLSDTDVVLPPVPVPIVTGAVGDWSLIYCGEITLPLAAKAAVGNNGRGIRMRSADTDARFIFRLTASATVGSTLEMLDAILVPYDEAMAEMRFVLPTDGVTAVENFILDNTGYLARGEARDIAGRTGAAASGINGPLSAVELRGQAPMLLPRIDQRLYFINSTLESGVSYLAQPDTDMNVRLNIVPRCYGVAAL